MNFNNAINRLKHSVSFAGSIVPRVKELLSSEKERWDKFEWDLDQE